MAEKRTRRRFTAEFKAQAVEQLLEGGRTPKWRFAGLSGTSRTTAERGGRR
jgi:transposase-like protein